MLERFARDKHSSLFCSNINDEGKKILVSLKPEDLIETTDEWTARSVKIVWLGQKHQLVPLTVDTETK
jgi:hypothetical protein